MTDYDIAALIQRFDRFEGAQGKVTGQLSAAIGRSAAGRRRLSPTHPCDLSGHRASHRITASLTFGLHHSPAGVRITHAQPCFTDHDDDDVPTAAFQEVRSRRRHVGETMQA
ncbi:hypothetical protein [Streptomyces sp. NPDC057302]|uniref:hypothetical protein n=1 Tax=Streptomyces sp. NPDC057302 TaxID=3346094 RepID=UPI00363C48B6